VDVLIVKSWKSRYKHFSFISSL